MASGHRKKTVGKRKTAKSSPPGDGEVKGRKRCVTHSSLNVRSSSSSAFKRPGGKLKARARINISWVNRSCPGAYNARPQSHVHLCLELPTRPTRAWEIKATSSHNPGTTPRSYDRSHGAERTSASDPMVTSAMRNVHSHLAERPAGRNLPNEPPIGSISKRLDDMLSTPFCSHITHYEPPRGFLVPKFSTYDGTNDPFDHIMHYRQLMTLDIGNDALLCKVFPASLQGQALSWFHRLPPNSVDNFRDLSEAFVG
ncbi:hypothetical protein CK203_013118 [Vitis vinifera]|uniref:Retrotransposon gag domain-containing protein n=1 Tax=Vitis vinifera TaxID=29760 RepID=A0A438JLQ7_VITVI|nr:hypothetical protein CK203_013118 [Vitis vinifera]